MDALWRLMTTQTLKGVCLNDLVGEGDAQRVGAQSRTVLSFFILIAFSPGAIQARRSNVFHPGGGMDGDIAIDTFNRPNTRSGGIRRRCAMFSWTVALCA